MPRRLRETYAGAVHHVFLRGNNGERVYADSTDFQVFLNYVGSACERTACVVHAYCVMPNHYHLVLETPEGNLSTAMRFINGRYARWFNDRHERTGHVFGTRFNSRIIEDDEYLLTAVRYLALNPVTGAAPQCERPGEWRWSSYAAALGSASKPPWLRTDRIFALFGHDEATARIRLRAFVEAGFAQPAQALTWS